MVIQKLAKKLEISRAMTIKHMVSSILFPFKHSYPLPLVGKKIPFVNAIKPQIIPLICKNNPFVIFRPIRRDISGFTLIELVVTIAVASILVAVALPNFRTLLQNSRMTTHVNELLSDVNFARSEAIKRRSNITICSSTTGTSCTGGNWRDGRLIMDASAIVLRVRGPFEVSTDTLTTTGPDPLIFDRSGALPITTSFTFCDSRGAIYGKLLNLNAIGQPTLDRAAPPGAC